MLNISFRHLWTNNKLKKKIQQQYQATTTAMLHFRFSVSGTSLENRFFLFCCWWLTMVVGDAWFSSTNSTRLRRGNLKAKQWTSVLYSNYSVTPCTLQMGGGDLSQQEMFHHKKKEITHGIFFLIPCLPLKIQADPNHKNKTPPRQHHRAAGFPLV